MDWKNEWNEKRTGEMEKILLNPSPLTLYKSSILQLLYFHFFH